MAAENFTIHFDFLNPQSLMRFGGFIVVQYNQETVSSLEVILDYSV
ncbi:hypothetical protein M595_1199 [Lyngbya aestuarii BL J]|uniref:Uncharacterized protein n=1 Tax=Lyngbya aestuarii BL J TaxID=1348334 RepID=U7QLG3_9CYAN|nr:hypothetical protein M595_1199 [Lyngbya aestuarii BL J]